MTYSLPFGLTQKPTNHYFEHGVVKFNVREGSLYYLVRKITKTGWATITKGQVRDKQQLDVLLKAKSFNEILSIEGVA